MIRLSPTPDVSHDCPHCDARLTTLGWLIPGMRNLAELRCPRCQRAYYGDLPAGGGLYYPMLLEQDTGVVHDRCGVPWFARWLEDSYRNRTSSPVPLIAEEVRTPGRAVVLNCLDALYGHCLLKLLNAQHYLDACPNYDLIVLAPQILRWMIPDGVAAVWSVDLPLHAGTRWNDWLAGEVKRRVEAIGPCWLAAARSHPHPQDYDIARFTRTAPFPEGEWDDRLVRPTVTFNWREDRCWSDARSATARLAHQRERVLAFAGALRASWPALDFAVAGMGASGDLPDDVRDLRRAAIDEATERQWCTRYASSHLVAGIHGSNMLLPSAHGGATISLTPPERWNNAFQDILFREGDSREAAWRYRAVPSSIRPDELARLADSILRFHGAMRRLLWSDECRRGASKASDV